MAHAFHQQLDLLQDPCVIRLSSPLLSCWEWRHLTFQGQLGQDIIQRFLSPLLPRLNLFLPLPPLSRLWISSLAFPSAHPIPKAVLQPQSWCVGFFILLFILLIFVCSENQGGDGAASVFISPWKCELRLPWVAVELSGYARS